jgi:hypothetical protein
MRKLHWYLVAAALAMIAAPRAAHANGVNLMLQADPLGLWGGHRISGTSLRSSTADYFERNDGGTIGFRAGLELKELELYFDYNKPYDTNNWE